MREVQCEGWWQQHLYGRQAMEPLTLTFDGTRLSGEGLDVVGPFHFSGTIDQGRVVLTKQYLGRHKVTYLGNYDGEGTLSGDWQIGFDRGQWLIRIVGQAAEHRRLTAEQIPLANFEKSALIP